MFLCDFQREKKSFSQEWRSGKKTFSVSFYWLFFLKSEIWKLKEKAEKIFHAHKNFTTNWFFFLNSFFLKLIMLKTEGSGTFSLSLVLYKHSSKNLLGLCVYNIQWHKERERKVISAQKISITGSFLIGKPTLEQHKKVEKKGICILNKKVQQQRHNS